jgi:hypothetical protein
MALFLRGFIKKLGILSNNHPELSPALIQKITAKATLIAGDNNGVITYAGIVEALGKQADSFLSETMSLQDESQATATVA